MAGQVYNIGGGPDHSLSIWAEFGPLLEELTGSEIEVEWDDWRPGDQPLYISDISKARRSFEWLPQVGVEEGIRSLYEWVVSNRELFD